MRKIVLLLSLLIEFFSLGYSYSQSPNSKTEIGLQLDLSYYYEPQYGVGAFYQKNKNKFMFGFYNKYENEQNILLTYERILNKNHRKIYGSLVNHLALAIKESDINGFGTYYYFGPGINYSLNSNYNFGMFCTMGWGRFHFNEYAYNGEYYHYDFKYLIAFYMSYSF